jgi:3-hydroxyisobutyrate dehydrogenase
VSARVVGFVGLGNMGGRMTRRLVDAGIEVVGYDPRPGAAESVGARAAASPAEVARRAPVVLMSLPDSHVVEPVVRGQDGLLTAARPGATIVDLSTASPASTTALHA